MYIIELILKQFRKKEPATPTYNPLEQTDAVEYESCEHVFMPIDSEGEVLSCTKCGILAKRSQFKGKNPFTS